MKRFDVLAGGAGIALVLTLHACSSSDAAGENTNDAGPEIDGSRPRSDASNEDSSAVVPSNVPDGWERFDDYDKSCGFYIPSAREYLPKGLEWEPCKILMGDAGAPGPPGMVCERMVTGWEPLPNGQHLQDYNPATLGADGKLRFLIRRFVKDNVVDLIADADGGAVHQALLQTLQPRRCLAFQPSLSRTHVIYGIVDDFKASGAGGAIGGKIDELRPTVYRPYGYLLGATLFPSFRAGDGVFVEDLNLDEVEAFDGGGLIATLPSQAEDIGASYTMHQFSGKDLFFVAASSKRVTIKSWTAVGGIKTLIGKDNDATRSSIGFATDGVDMVWLEASEREGTSQIYAKQDTWTAKYTTDPDVLAATKRRVRATTIEYGNVYKVGCGYAAVSAFTTSPWGQSGVRVIRLSDGVSWDVIDNSEAQLLQWHLSLPLAVTCDEVFVAGSTWRGTGSRHNEIMRIRIDSLGPGIPPT